MRVMKKKNQELSLDDLKNILKSEANSSGSDSSESDAQLTGIDPDTEDKQDLGNIESAFTGYDKEQNKIYQMQANIANSYFPDKE